MGSAMTLDSIDDLGIKEGDRVKLGIKAIKVLVVKEDQGFHTKHTLSGCLAHGPSVSAIWGLGWESQ
jgi:hypothetical protein